tara:strand:- start:1163 stop:1570 length:408 start_codon:yes stop_codon:yes gene_type:complete
MTGAKGRVLVVDDDVGVRKIVRFILEKHEYAVIEATNGEEAIETIQSGDNPLLVDVIICDVWMPKVNGTEAITFFLEQFPSIPIIVLTGYPDINIAIPFLQKWVMDYVVKPVEKKKLIQLVDTAVSTHAVFSHAL